MRWEPLIVGPPTSELKKNEKETKNRKQFPVLDLYCKVSDHIGLSEDLPWQDRKGS